MKKTVTFFTEAAYVVGLLGLAFGVTLMERADFGLSMVVAPAYVLHRYISTLPGMGWFTFGVAEYVLQAGVILLLTAAVRRFRLSYLFSFVTAVVYGYILDLFMMLIPTVAADQWGVRILFFVLGEVFCAVGVSMMFRTYIPPEAYELFVAQFALRYHHKTGTVKTVYDCVSCAVGIVLSFVFFGMGTFVGVSWGTVLCALTNGFIISLFGRLWDRLFRFRDGMKLRRFFER